MRRVLVMLVPVLLLAPPTLYGLERHLVQMHDLIEEFDPSVVVVDPISNLSATHNLAELKPIGLEQHPSS